MAVARHAPPPPGGVESPHYGDSLFYFFQGRYFTSVTVLMASQQIGRMAPHDDEAEILRGGLFLSYGMHREAGEVFAKLIERRAPQPVRDRAWFYLAKIRYQRGLYAESEDALGRIEKRLPGALEEDRVLLQANVLMARGNYVEAIKAAGAARQGAGRELCPLQPRRGAGAQRRHEGRHRAARRGRQDARRQPGVPRPARQGQCRAWFRLVAGRPRRAGARRTSSAFG